MGIQNLDVSLSMLLARDEIKLSAVELGSLLVSQNAMPCFPSIMHQFNVTRLNATVASIDDPVLSGFITLGLNQIVSSLVEVSFITFKPSILKTLPNFFQIKGHNLINDQVIQFFTTKNGNTCPAPKITDEYIDFQDLLLTPAQAKLMVGAGSTLYRDVAYKLFSTVQSELLGINPTTDKLKMT